VSFWKSLARQLHHITALPGSCSLRFEEKQTEEAVLLYSTAPTTHGILPAESSGLSSLRLLNRAITTQGVLLHTGLLETSARQISYEIPTCTVHRPILLSNHHLETIGQIQLVSHICRLFLLSVKESLHTGAIPAPVLVASYGQAQYLIITTSRFSQRLTICRLVPCGDRESFLSLRLWCWTAVCAYSKHAAQSIPQESPPSGSAYSTLRLLRSN
jgi:hypothetical protein